MYKHTINYTDYNGEKRSENHYFNLTKIECVDSEMSMTGGLATHINKIIETQDRESMYKIVKDFIILSYGEKSPDGRYFMKTDENGHKIVNKFMQSEAYSELMMELLGDAKKLVNFMNAIIPDVPEAKATAEKALEEALEEASASAN